VQLAKAHYFNPICDPGCCCYRRINIFEISDINDGSPLLQLPQEVVVHILALIDDLPSFFCCA